LTSVVESEKFRSYTRAESERKDKTMSSWGSDGAKVVMYLTVLMSCRNSNFEKKKNKGTGRLRQELNER